MDTSRSTHSQSLNFPEDSIVNTPEASSVIDDSDFVKNVLVQWGLSEYTEIFLNEKINKQVLLEMPNQTVVQLMPQVGDHTKFLLNREKYISLNKENHQSDTFRGEELRQLLQKNPLLKVLLDEKNITEHYTLIAHAIVNHILEKNGTLIVEEEDFIHWRNEIKSLWKNEDTDFWYHSYSPGSRKSGVLYHTYKNKLTKTRGIKRKQKKEEDENTKETKMNEKKFMEGKINEIIKRKNVDDTFFHLWTMTWHYRKNEKLPIDKLFQKYELLKPPTGQKLILKDFQLAAKEIDENSLKNKWTDLSLKIISHSAKTSKRATAAIGKYMRNANNKLKETLAWRALPFLLSPVPISTNISGKKSTKVSYAEQSNGFIRWIQNISEIDATMSKYQQSMDQHKHDIQPYIIAVGDIDDIKSALVILNKTKFSFTDVTSAVDFAWKAKIALNLKYAEVSKQIWVFIETYIYDCHVTKEKYTKVSKLVNALNNIDTNK